MAVMNEAVIAGKTKGDSDHLTKELPKKTCQHPSGFVPLLFQPHGTSDLRSYRIILRKFDWHHFRIRIGMRYNDALALVLHD